MSSRRAGSLLAGGVAIAGSKVVPVPIVLAIFCCFPTAAGWRFSATAVVGNDVCLNPFQKQRRIVQLRPFSREQPEVDYGTQCAEGTRP
jgi:hypothetical protein